MANVQGKDDILELSTDGGSTWKTLICETSHSFNFNRNTNRTPTKCDGGTSALGIGSYEWSFQSSVVVETAPTVTQVSYEDLLAWAVGATALLLRNSNGTSGANFHHSGSVYITDLSKTAEVDGLVTADVTFSGTNALDISF